MPAPFETADASILTPSLAQEIAGETSAIIGLNVIITDAGGNVIGSGDRSRVGTFHEASLEVVETQPVPWHDAQEARRLKGVRPGMTLPIVHAGTAVGTVGITGSPARVRRFGQVVKRQTEILLTEAVLLRSRMTRERSLELLARDLLEYDVDHAGAIAAHARDLGFDLDVPRQAVLVQLGDPGTSSVAPAASVLRMLRETFSHPQDISCTLATTHHLVLRHHQPDEPVCSDLMDLSDRLAAQLAHRPRIGIGGVARRVDGLGRSYEEAQTALRAGPLAGLSSPFDINDLRVEQLITALPARLRAHVADEVIGPLRRQGDWATTRATVVAWVESGFVLVDAAAALNVHRNTLVYRIGRIASTTGRATSDRRYWLALYLACVSDAHSEPSD